MPSLTDDLFDKVQKEQEEQRKIEEERLRREQEEKFRQEQEKARIEAEKKQKRKEFLAKFTIKNIIQSAKDKREQKEQEKIRKEKEAREKEERLRKEKELILARKTAKLEEIKGYLSTIMETYPKMTGNYYKDENIEIAKDDEGNILGIIGNYSFVSNNKGQILFCSKPISTTSSRITGPTAWDTEETCYIHYDSAVAELTDSKELEVSMDNLKSHAIKDIKYDNPYTEDEIRKLMSQTMFMQVRNQINSISQKVENKPKNNYKACLKLYN